MDVQIVGRWGTNVVGHGRFRVSGGGVRASDVMAGLDGWAMAPGNMFEGCTVGGVTFQVEPIEKLKEFREPESRGPFWFIVAVAGLCHLLLLATFAFFLPSLSADEDGSMDRDRIILLRSYMESHAEQEPEMKTTQAGQNGPSGSGATTHVTTEPTGGLPGPQGSMQAGPHGTRDGLLQEAGEFGILGILGSVEPGPGTQWGTGAVGSMWGTSIEDTVGWGLGPLGPDGSGGGPAGVIRTGPPGALGHCNVDCGIGVGHGTVPGTHVIRVPQVRPAPVVAVGGRLPPETIRRVVQLSQGRVIACYAAGLQRNPGLAGRIQVRFVIGRDGSVQVAQEGGATDLPDPQVRSCVVNTFLALTFPEPQGGIVQVTYPFLLSPE